MNETPYRIASPPSLPAAAPAPTPKAYRIVVKEGLFWRALAAVVYVVTFGRNRTFLTEYLTTIGLWIGIPAGLRPEDVEGAPTIEHEKQHVEQCVLAGRVATLGLGWLLPDVVTAVIGIVPWGLLYLFLPLPLGLAWFRYAFERSAYLRGFRAQLALLTPAGARIQRAQLIDLAVAQLTTGAYGWTWVWPGAVRAWFEARL